MKKKILWLVVSCLMVLSLVIASCGPKVVEKEKVEVGKEEVTITEEEVEKEVVEEEEKEMVKLTLTKLDGTTVEKMVEKPKYGGTIVRMPVLTPRQFNPIVFSHTLCGTVYFTQEGLIEGDWTKGPAGTGDADFLNSFGGRMELMTGWLAESWDIPDDETIVFHIRKGVHWWNKPPVNGREVTADDVVWTMEQLFTSATSYYAAFTRAGENPTSIKALDKYTVEVKLRPEVLGAMLFEIGDRIYIYPAKITEQVDLNDWRNAIGTGAWMLVDFVPDTSATFLKNPNYWQYDPLHPENRLPYPDKMQCPIIADASTQQAAFRTGKLDQLGNVSWEDFGMFMKQCPKLEYIQTYPDMPPLLVGRMDKPELPFHDIRVRQALNMAINKQELIDDYYGGYADMLGYPVCNANVFKPIYRPLEEYPEAVQELFTYNPEKARQLLAEAGYPNGFKTVIQCASTNADFNSIIREYFLDIGVDMSIEVLESGVMSSVSTGRTHKEMINAITKSSVPFMFLTERKEKMDCKSMWTHPLANEYYQKVSAVLGRDDAEVIRLVREIAPYLLESAWGVWLPVPYRWTMWWPWVKNFHGEQDLGYCNQGRERTYTWLDTALKKSMGY